jgi:hypothetical protein
MQTIKKMLYKKGEELKREEEGDQEGQDETIFFASGRPTKAVFRQNSAFKKAATFQNLTGSREPLKAT